MDDKTRELSELEKEIIEEQKYLDKEFKDKSRIEIVGDGTKALSELLIKLDKEEKLDINTKDEDDTRPLVVVSTMTDSGAGAEALMNLKLDKDKSSYKAIYVPEELPGLESFEDYLRIRQIPMHRGAEALYETIIRQIQDDEDEK